MTKKDHLSTGRRPSAQRRPSVSSARRPSVNSAQRRPSVAGGPESKRKQMVKNPVKKPTKTDKNATRNTNFGGTDIKAKIEPETTEKPEYLEEKKSEKSSEHVEQQMTNWLDVNSKLQKLLAANLNRPGSAAVVRKDNNAIELDKQEESVAEQKADEPPKDL